MKQITKDKKYFICTESVKHLIIKSMMYIFTQNTPHKCIHLKKFQILKKFQMFVHATIYTEDNLVISMHICLRKIHFSFLMSTDSKCYKMTSISNGILGWKRNLKTLLKNQIKFNNNSIINCYKDV